MLSYKLYGTPFWDALSQKAKTHPALAEMLAEFDTPPDDEVAAADEFGCLLLRIFLGGRYCFCFPIPYTDAASVTDALDAIEHYALTQEVPLFYINVPDADLDALCARYRFARSEPIDDGLFAVSVTTEPQRLTRIPTLRARRITLGRLTPLDILPYAALCRDASTLQYFGYDLRSDGEGARSRDFYRAAMREFRRGIAIPFAIRHRAALVGEITLYGFDGRGRAEFSVRIRPKYRRRGYAREAIEAVCRYAFSTLGLSRLSARCRCENTPCRALLASIAPCMAEEAGVLHFLLSGDEPR